MCGEFQDREPSSKVQTSTLYDVRLENRKSVTLDLWDTLGQERFRTINTLYYKNANAALIVYDITNVDSFEAIKNYWYDEVKACACKDVVIGIIGNKADLFEQEKVSEEEVKKYAKSKGAFFMLVSAKDGTGIYETFKFVAEKLKGNGEIHDDNTIKLKQQFHKKIIIKCC